MSGPMFEFVKSGTLVITQAVYNEAILKICRTSLYLVSSVAHKCFKVKNTLTIQLTNVFPLVFTLAAEVRPFSAW